MAATALELHARSCYLSCLRSPSARPLYEPCVLPRVRDTAVPDTHYDTYTPHRGSRGLALTLQHSFASL